MEKSGWFEKAAVGLGGALAVTAANELGRRYTHRAPRLDVMGMRLFGRAIEGVGLRAPRGKTMRALALAGDLLTNTAFYGLVAAGTRRRPITRGLGLGLAAGVAALALPERVGVRAPGQRHRRTRALTLRWYMLGGLAAGLVCTAFARRA